MAGDVSMSESSLPPQRHRRRSAGAGSGSVRSQALGRGPGALTNVSWSAADGMSFEQWVLSGRQLGAIGRGVGWWIGDWLRYGNGRYGEKYAQASKITGYDTQTLMNMVYVASNVHPSWRREQLSWSHHAEVAAMSIEEQDRWLELAERSRLSVQDLRQLLRKARQRENRAELAVVPEAPPAAVCPSCGHAFAATAELAAAAAASH